MGQPAAFCSECGTTDVGAKAFYGTRSSDWRRRSCRSAERVYVQVQKKEMNVARLTLLQPQERDSRAVVDTLAKVAELAYESA